MKLKDSLDSESIGYILVSATETVYNHMQVTPSHILLFANVSVSYTVGENLWPNSCLFLISAHTILFLK